MVKMTRNGNGRYRESNLSMVIACVAIGLSVLQAFWSIADPRGIITKLETKFDQYITVREFEEHKKNNLKMREMVHKEIDTIKKDLDELVKVLGAGNTIGDRLKYIQDQISALRDKVLIPPKEVLKP